MPSGLLVWLLLPVAAYLVWAGSLFLLQRRLIYPRHLLSPAVGRADPGAEGVALETPGGGGQAWYLAPVRSGGGSGAGPDPATTTAGRTRTAGRTTEGRTAPVDGPPAPAVIFAHGNAETALDWAAPMRSVAAQGVAVLLVEYPGYDGTPGAPSQASITGTMVAAFDHLAGRAEVDPRRIVGVGRSLGGGAVAALAGERPLAGLVLQSSFTSVADFAGRLLLPRALVRDPFDNVAAVSAFEGPVLVMHGRRDEVIPYEHGRRLARAARQGRLVTWDCGHNDCPGDWTAYVQDVAAFARAAPPVEAPGGNGEDPVER